MKKTLFAIIGEAGSGKDYLVKELTRQYPEYFCPLISYTTRPKRDNEINNIDYYFISELEFKNLIKNNEFLEHTSFRGWYYGTGISSLQDNKINIGVFNINGILNIQSFKNEIDLTVFRLLVDNKKRLERQLNREKNPDVDEIVRRYLTDKKDFSSIPFESICLFNNSLQDLEDNKRILLIKAKSALGHK